MSTARASISSLFSVVTGTATAATTLINSATSGAEMLGNFVTKAKDEQEYRYSLEKKVYQENIKNQFADELASRGKEIAKKRSDEEYNKQFTHYLDLLSAPSAS